MTTTITGGTRLWATNPQIVTLSTVPTNERILVRGADYRAHKDASLTMRLYAHSQFAALQDAGASLDRVVTSCDTEPRGHAR